MITTLFVCVHNAESQGVIQLDDISDARIEQSS